MASAAAVRRRGSPEPWRPGSRSPLRRTRTICRSLRYQFRASERYCSCFSLCAEDGVSRGRCIGTREKDASKEKGTAEAVPWNSFLPSISIIGSLEKYPANYMWHNTYDLTEVNLNERSHGY